MVDKENQWEDIEEYPSEDGQNQDYDTQEQYSDEELSDEEFSEQDYDDYDEYDDEEEDSSRKKKSSLLPVLILFFVLLGLAGFILMSKMSANRESSVADNTGGIEIASEQTTPSDSASGETGASDADDFFFEQENADSSDMMSFDFNEKGEAQVATSGTNGDVVATVTDAPQDESVANDMFSEQGDLNLDPSQENNAIMISYNKPVRENPFKPPVYSKEKDSNVVINNTEFEIIEPPVTSVPDENLTKLLQTQISGILYDDLSPSAIVNLNGVDTFVKVGDTISGYTIQAITRDKVQINYKNNSYVASVGELFTRGVLERRPAVANLQKKFAGRYKDIN